MGRRLLAVSLVAVLVLAGVTPALASSHREAPLITEDPVADNTDVYAFRPADQPGRVVFVANFSPFEEPAGGPNFYRFGDSVLYQIVIFNNRDRSADIVYQFRFRTTIRNRNTFLYNTGPITSLTDPDFNVRQSYTVTRIKNGKAQVLGRNLPTPPNSIGPSSTPNYEPLAESAVRTLSDGSCAFAGQRDDPFFADTGALFDLLTIRKLPGTDGGVDGLGGFNTQTIALSVPISEITRNRSIPTSTTDPASVIGVYANASRRQVTVLRHDRGPGYSGRFIQVSRLGEPLVNELLIPLGHKDEWNRSNPIFDAQFLPFYRSPEPAALINAIYGVPVPPTPRNDIAALLLNGITVSGFTNAGGGPANADLLRLNLAVPASNSPNRFGILGGDVAGFPNGRRLADDVVDIEIRALAGATPFTPTFDVAPNNQLGDGVNTNDRTFLDHFPYVAEPGQGFSHTHHPTN